MRPLVLFTLLLANFSAGLGPHQSSPQHRSHVPLVLSPPYLLPSGEELPPQSDHQPEPSDGTLPSPVAEALRREVVDLINAERARHGLAPLAIADELQEAALRHVRDMAGNGFLAHVGSDETNPGQRIREARYEYLAAGEVIASNSDDPSTIVALWLGSPAHRAILMDPVYSDLGAAVVPAEESSHGARWVVNLGRRLEPNASYVALALRPASHL